MSSKNSSVPAAINSIFVSHTAPNSKLRFSGQTSTKSFSKQSPRLPSVFTTRQARGNVFVSPNEPIVSPPKLYRSKIKPTPPARTVPSNKPEHSNSTKTVPLPVKLTRISVPDVSTGNSSPAKIGLLSSNHSPAKAADATAALTAKTANNT